MHTRPLPASTRCHGRPHPTSPGVPGFSRFAVAGERSGSRPGRTSWPPAAPHSGSGAAARPESLLGPGCLRASQPHVALPGRQLAVAGRTSVTGPLCQRRTLAQLELASWGPKPRGKGLKRLPLGPPPRLCCPRWGSRAEAVSSRLGDTPPAPRVTLCLLR